jgi:hypothetical protein
MHTLQVERKGRGGAVSVLGHLPLSPLEQGAREQA